MNIYTSNNKQKSSSYTVYAPVSSTDAEVNLSENIIEIDAQKRTENDFTTYPCDCSTEDGTCINIRPNCINIQFSMPAKNPVLSELEADIEDISTKVYENKVNIEQLENNLTVFENNTIQTISELDREISELYGQDANIRADITSINVKVRELQSDFNNFDAEFINKSELDAAVEPLASKTYVDEEIAKIDVSDQLKDYAKIRYVDEEISKIDFVDDAELSSAISDATEPLASKTYVDEEIAKIDISEQLANYVDKTSFEDSEMATAQLFAVLNEDIFYKADKSELMYYSTLEYVDRKDAQLTRYIDSDFLKIEDYEKNTEETNYVLAQTIATLNERIDNAVDVDMTNYYNKTEVDALIDEIPTFDSTDYYNKTYIDSNYYTSSKVDELIETATGVDFSNYYTKTETDSAISTAISQLDYVDETELQTALSTKITVWSGTQAEYDALTEIDDKIMYMIYE